MKKGFKFKVLFLILSVFLVLFLIGTRRILWEYFSTQSERIRIEVFNELLKENAENNLIAKPDFFLAEDNKIKCLRLDFFLKKFNVEIAEVNSIVRETVNFIVFDGIEVKGKWQIAKSNTQEFTVFFYYCNPVKVKKTDKKKLSMIEKNNLRKNIDAMEVVGENGYYEIFGKFWWIEEGEPCGEILEIGIFSLTHYEIKSTITERKMKLDVSDFKQLNVPSHWDNLKFHFCNFFAEFFLFWDNLLLKIGIKPFFR